jgi:hypothetical protein
VSRREEIEEQEDGQEEKEKSRFGEAHKNAFGLENEGSAPSTDSIMVPHFFHT